MSTYSNVKLGISHEVGSLVISKGKMEWQEKPPGSKHIAIDASEIKNLEWLNIDAKKKLMRITFSNKQKEWVRFIGFANDDEIELDKICKKHLSKGLNPKMVNLSGQSWGKFVLRGQDMVCRTEQKHIIFTVPYQSISQSVIQARNEISLEFKDPPKRKGDTLCEMRMFIPDDEEGAAYEEFHDTLMKKAKLESDQAAIIAWFKNITFRVPRGNKEIYFYPNHFLFRTDTFAYRIKYTQIRRLFVFEQPGEKVAFLVHLSPGIRQGYQTYGYLIMEFPEDEICETKINATSEQLKSEYASKDGKQILNKRMEGPTYDVLSRVFMALSKIKIIAAKKFTSSEGFKCLTCSLGANSGLLYPLEKSIFFIWKPVSYIRHADIAKVTILRMEQSHNIKMFDAQIHLKKSATPLVFTGIGRNEYEHLMRYFLSKPNIHVEGKQMHEARLNNTMLSNSRSTRTRKNIKASSGNLEAVNFGGFNLDDDDEDDDDYNMDDDKRMLDEDEDHDAQFDQITEKMTLSDHDAGEERRKKKKKKKKRHSKEEAGDDAMIDSDEDVDMK